MTLLRKKQGFFRKKMVLFGQNSAVLDYLRFCYTGSDKMRTEMNTGKKQQEISESILTYQICRAIMHMTNRNAQNLDAFFVDVFRIS